MSTSWKNTGEPSFHVILSAGHAASVRKHDCVGLVDGRIQVIINNNVVVPGAVSDFISCRCHSFPNGIGGVRSPCLQTSFQHLQRGRQQKNLLPVEGCILF